MEFTKVTKAFKKHFVLSKTMNLPEKPISLFEESNGYLEGKDTWGNSKNNSCDNLVRDDVKLSKLSEQIWISQNLDNPLIQLTDIWKIYQMGENEFAALKGISLEIYEGEFLVVLGPSGSGKSTLMNLLGCLDLPSRGTIFLNSRDISDLEESELALVRGQTIGFIFQSFNLIPTLNTVENVLLPLEFQEEDAKIARKKADYLLDIVGLSDKKQNLPSQLSGGQRQRVAIARSLAVNPPIILADEPTGNLDSKTGNYILDFLDNLNKKEGKTIIIVTHDLDIVKYATRVVYIRDGQIEKINIQTKNEKEELK